MIDGFVGMEGRGPVDGTTFQMDLILVGNDPIVTYATACRVMGIDPQKIDHIRKAYDRSIGNIDDIQVLGKRLENVTYMFKRRWPSQTI